VPRREPSPPAAELSLSFDGDALDHVAEVVAERVAERVADRLTDRLAARTDDRWLDTAEAAAYVGRTPAALHKLTAAQAIPFAQDGPRAKCYFRRSDLDRWMAANAANPA
jgi:hypothetical protein